ncbi:MAG: hypothetical protein ABI600_01750 [Luteolibacter sp.]
MFLLSPAVLMAREPAASPEARKKLPAVGLLPDGSELKGVILPRYDENHKLIEVLKAKKMILVNDEQIAGETVSVDFFNPDQSPRGRIDLTRAVFYQTRGVLEAKEPVTVTADRLTANGIGLYYAFQKGEGFLLGPATTTIHPPTETTMNTPSSPIRATAMIGMSLLTQSLVAAPPPAMTEKEKSAIQADAASKASTAAEAGAATRKDLQTSIAASQAADSAAQAFLAQNSLPVPAASAPAATAKPLGVTPGPEDTVIKCDGGVYFDADEGVLVYMKNVTVTDSRFDLSGANELKVFFVKKPADAPKKEKPGPSDQGLGNVGGNFSEVDRILATGAVRLLQKKTTDNKPPIEASGAIFSYQVKSGEIILSGGYPWVKQGDSFMRAGEPNLNLRIQKSGSFSTEGNWTMGGNLNQKN